MGPAPAQKFEGRGLMDGQKGYLNFIDMINGGGMGRAGDKFEGGGLLSLLGNALGIAPYGSRDRQEAAQKALAEGAASMSSRGAAPAVDRVKRASEMATAPLNEFGGAGPNIPNAMPSFGSGPIDAFGGVGPMQYGGRGNAGMPAGYESIDAFGGVGPMQYGGRGNAGMPVGYENIPSQVGSMGMGVDIRTPASAIQNISQSGSGMVDTPAPAYKPMSLLDMATSGTDNQKDEVYNKFLIDLNNQFDGSIVEDLQNTGGIWDLYQTYLQNNGSFR